MPMYVIDWEETRRYIGFVEAESESAARQAWIDDDLDVRCAANTAESRQLSIEECDHDQLCACPWCFDEEQDAELHRRVYGTEPRG